MSLLGSNLYCVPFNDVPQRQRTKLRQDRQKMSPGQRLHDAVIKRGRYISLAEHMHELSLPDHDAVLKLVLADPDLGLATGPRGCGSKLVVPVKDEPGPVRDIDGTWRDER